MIKKYKHVLIKPLKQQGGFTLIEVLLGATLAGAGLLLLTITAGSINKATKGVVSNSESTEFQSNAQILLRNKRNCKRSGLAENIALGLPGVVLDVTNPSLASFDLEMNSAGKYKILEPARFALEYETDGVTVKPLFELKTLLVGPPLKKMFWGKLVLTSSPKPGKNFSVRRELATGFIIPLKLEMEQVDVLTPDLYRITDCYASSDEGS